MMSSRYRWMESIEAQGQGDRARQEVGSDRDSIDSVYSINVISFIVNCSCRWMTHIAVQVSSSSGPLLGIQGSNTIHYDTFTVRASYH